MPCYRPITAYKAPGGAITFHEGGDSGPELKLPCGRCIGCRKKRTSDWATRCMHEAQLHTCNSFVTLTFDDDHHKPSLDYEDFRLFMKRLRRHKRDAWQEAGSPGEPPKIRFFAAGEYGTHTLRPHWHALLFNCAFANQQPLGPTLWRSPELEQLWPKGFSSIGEVTWQSAAYVASYCIKKATGPLANIRYARVDLTSGELYQVQPELARMSLKPGIGADWLKKYWQEVYLARDGVVRHGGKQTPPPRYYDKKMAVTEAKLMLDKESTRQANAILRAGDNTYERLKVKENIEIQNQQRKREMRKL